jgi:hypothetical protein
VIREHDAGSDLSKEAPGTSSSLSADQRHTGFHNRALMGGSQHHAAGHVRDLSFCLKDPSEIELIENGLYVLILLHFSQVFSVIREHDDGSDLSKEAPGTSSSLSDHGHLFSLGNSLTHL